MDGAKAAQIGDYRRIIDFRNVLIHGYDIVDEAVVWDIVKQDLPVFLQHVRSILAGLGPP